MSYHADSRRGIRMIIEKLVKQSDFTDVEKSIADYLLRNGYEIKNMSISELAQASYTSPSTITRLCRKLDTDGYKQFRILFNTEYQQYASQGFVDANHPFSGADSFEQIARNLEKLNQETIRKTVSHLDYNQLHRVVRRMGEADMINVFGIGTSVNVAMDFQQKMLRFGRVVNLTQSACFLPGYALAATPKSVNLIISLSGQTRDIVECLRLLQKKKRYCVAITASSDSPAARMCSEVICVGVDEDLSYESKIDTFAVYNAFHFVLDCIFSFLYRLNYDSNEKKSKENASSIKESKNKSV